MVKQPLVLTPDSARVLVRCPLHYHFRQISSREGTKATPQGRLDAAVRQSIQRLHAAGGPARLPLETLLAETDEAPPARQMVERYYERLRGEWAQMMAGNEMMALKISLGGVSLVLKGTVDRLDRTADGGVAAILFRTAAGPAPTAADLRADHAMTVYHALVASTYPLKRPVRIREWWLQTGQSVEIELSEAEYRRNLSQLREPVQALARSEVRARPGLHCDVCPFKYQGCPVYAHEAPEQSEGEEFAPSSTPSKIPHRKWIFKI